MIKARNDERIAILHFALDKLRDFCRLAKRNMNGASQQKINQGTEAGIKNH
jgi:hypothetical protein